MHALHSSPSFRKHPSLSCLLRWRIRKDILYGIHQILLVIHIFIDPPPPSLLEELLDIFLLIFYIRIRKNVRYIHILIIRIQIFDKAKIDISIIV